LSALVGSNVEVSAITIDRSPFYDGFGASNFRVDSGKNSTARIDASAAALREFAPTTLGWVARSTDVNEVLLARRTLQRHSLERRLESASTGQHQCALPISATSSPLIAGHGRRHTSAPDRQSLLVTRIGANVGSIEAEVSVLRRQ